MEYLIQTKHLDFYYGKNHIIKGLNLKVPKGSIYGFLGPNGAGKSTTMQLLTGLLHNFKGSISILGNSIPSNDAQLFSRVGALVESPALYLHLSGEDNLKYICKLKELDPAVIPSILETVGLSGKGQLKVKKYSLGMKQRLAIGMALLGDPDLLFLDEPVNGLDPVGITEVRELLIKLNQDHGTTIFISSHLLSEIEKMCTHVGIIHHGELQFEGTMNELKSLKEKHQVTLETSDLEKHLSVIQSAYPNSAMKDSKTVEINLDEKSKIPELATFLVAKEIPIYSLNSEDGLENWFLSLTQ